MQEHRLYPALPHLAKPRADCIRFMTITLPFTHLLRSINYLMDFHHSKPWNQLNVILKSDKILLRTLRRLSITLPWWSSWFCEAGETEACFNRSSQLIGRRSGCMTLSLVLFPTSQTLLFLVLGPWTSVSSSHALLQTFKSDVHSSLQTLRSTRTVLTHFYYNVCLVC